LLLFRQSFTLHISDYLSGFACLFAYISLVQYLDFSAKYSFILKTLTFCFPIIVRTMVGIMPIFIGCTLLSILLFGASIRFQNASYAAMNLYSMIAGDELQDVFRDLTGFQMLLSLIFLYLYVFFGVAVITNSLIAIVAQGFKETKRLSRFDWAKFLDRQDGN
jgi:hypothetical protein